MLRILACRGSSGDSHANCMCSGGHFVDAATGLTLWVTPTLYEGRRSAESEGTFFKNGPETDKGAPNATEAIAQ
eukprot:3148846-Amphidinium_carterae.1